jgi:hypothetical protein
MAHQLMLADGHSTLNLVRSAQPVGGALRPADDVATLRWFAPDRVPPPHRLAFDFLPDAIECWRHQRFGSL